jgi:hypothetical protein
MPAVIERLTAFGLATADGLPPSVAGKTVALGWATVDMERAVREVGDALGIPADRFVVAPDTRLLGATCRMASGVLPGGAAVVVLEPATEGRLAATLARLGEGPSATWLVGPEDPAAGEGPAEAIATSAQRDGPLGPERLVLGGPAHGPHRLLVRPPGTIRA